MDDRQIWPPFIVRREAIGGGACVRMMEQTNRFRFGRKYKYGFTPVDTISRTTDRARERERSRRTYGNAICEGQKAVWMSCCSIVDYIGSCVSRVALFWQYNRVSLKTQKTTTSYIYIFIWICFRSERSAGSPSIAASNALFSRTTTMGRIPRWWFRSLYIMAGSGWALQRSQVEWCSGIYSLLIYMGRLWFDLLFDKTLTFFN